MGHPPVAGGWGEAVLPPEAGLLTTNQAAKAEAITGAEGAEATASPSEATESPPEAPGCPEEAARTGAEGTAGLSELLMRIRLFFLFFLSTDTLHSLLQFLFIAIFKEEITRMCRQIYLN